MYVPVNGTDDMLQIDLRGLHDKQISFFELIRPLLETQEVFKRFSTSGNLSTRPFCKSEHYWDTLFFMQENVKKAFDEKGINIPYPTMDLNVTNNQVFATKKKLKVQVINL